MPITNWLYMVVSINGDTPNGWFIMENLMNMDDKWGTPILGTPHVKQMGLRIIWDKG